MNRTSIGKGALAALVMLSTGCAYSRARALDLADCFSASVGAGLELSADAQATDLLHLGVGGGVHQEVGFVGRRYGAASVFSIFLPVTPFLEQVGYGRYAMEVAGTWSEDDVQDECYVVHVLDKPPTNPRRAWIDAWDVEVGAMVLVGGRVGIRPGQMLDFLGGWFGWDPAGDDARTDEPGSLESAP